MSTYYIAGYPISDELYHHGIKGQRWGVRRYQNEDGTLTALGKARYGSVENFKNAQEYKQARKDYRKTKSAKDLKRLGNAYDKYDKSKTKESVKRGQELVAKGRTKGGAIGRAVGRQAAIHAVAMAGGMAITAIAMKNMFSATSAAELNNAAGNLMRTASVGGKFIKGLAVGATAYNVYKGVRQYKDIDNAEKNMRRRE